MRATSGVELAWATMAAEAWTRMLYFAKRVLSAAMSTSTIRPKAASMLDDCLVTLSDAKLSLDMVPPF